MSTFGFRAADIALVGVAVLLVTGLGLLGATPAAQGASRTRIDQQAPPPPPPPPPPGAGLPGPDARLLDRLGLTTEQSRQVESILEQARADSEPYHDELRASRDAMRAAVEADVFDEAAVRTIAASRADATIEITMIDARARAAICRLLTPEQRTLLRKFESQPPPPRRR